MAGLLKKLFGQKHGTEIRCAAVVPAAGNSTRMGADKLQLELGGIPVLVHTLRALDSCPYVEEIIVVTREDLIVPVSQMCREYGICKASKVIKGGATRTLSVLSGIQEVSPALNLVAIHDGARPLVGEEVLEEVIRRAAQCGAAAPAVPVKDTIKEAVDGLITATPDRNRLHAVQTPQVFETDLIRTALTQALQDGAELTDDCSAVERLGIGVVLTKGSYMNLKITTQEDLVMAQALLEWKEEL